MTKPVSEYALRVGAELIEVESAEVADAYMHLVKAVRAHMVIEDRWLATRGQFPTDYNAVNRAIVAGVEDANV